jgi:transposase
MEVSMRNDSTVFVALDVHQKSIVGAFAVNAGEIHDLGNIGTLQRDLDRLCRRMQAKAARVRFVYEAGPCGYAVYRYLTGKGFDCSRF